FFDAGAELLSRGGEVAGEVARLVDQVDQILADHAPDRIGNGKRQLLAQPVGECRFGGDEGFEIVFGIAAIGPAATARPIWLAGRPLGRARPRRLAVIRGGVVEPVVGLIGVVAPVIVAFGAIIGLAVMGLAIDGGLFGPVGAIARGGLILGGAVEQRI